MFKRVIAPATMLLALSLVYRRLLAGNVLAGGDLHLYFYPYWSLVSRLIGQGDLPLWNPYLFAGAPLLANSQVGVFYPLNWPFWLLASLLSSGEEAVRALPGVALALHASVLVHLALAALATYRLARSRHLERWAGAFAGFLYGAGGFLGVHVEHLNQLQALAWLPLLFLPLSYPVGLSGSRVGRWLRRLAGGGRVGERELHLPHPLSLLAFAMIVLAGHTQMAFIAGIGLLLWHMARAALSPLERAGRPDRVGVIWRAFRRRFVGLFPFGIAIVIAAAQLLPTLQLMGLSGRQGGLPWREAVSFSVPPWQLHRSLLPPYLVTPLLPEGVAYLGLPALLLAGYGCWCAVRRRRTPALGWALVAAGGLLLALGGYNPLYLAAVGVGVPGLAHFRAPARFLALYVLGGALLAGYGTDQMLAVLDRRSRLLRGAGVALFSILCVAESVVASVYLPHADATTPRAYTDLRPAAAHLVSAAQSDLASAMPPARFLSISKTLFEVGDKPEIEGIYADRLSEGALWAYLVATKQREVLAPNLPAAFRVPAVDGYDGGLLPTQPYMRFSRLLLPGGSVDGRLRENLAAVPDQRWLSLLGVRFFLTDKTADAWVDDIFYDRQFQPDLQPGEALTVAWLPPDFAADGLGLLYEGTGGEVIVRLAGGQRHTLPLPPAVEGVQRLRWEEAAVVEGLELRASGSPLKLQGISLVDERLGAFYPLTLSDRFRLVHSGDVKIYEDVIPPPRAFMAYECRETSSPDEALSMMRDPTFDPYRHLVLAPGQSCLPGAGPQPGGEVSIVRYDAASVVVTVETPTPGYLVLADGWYPGWQAWVAPLGSTDPGRRQEVFNVDLLFRAVPVAAGRWQVIFRYRLGWNWVGVGIALVGVVLLVLYTIEYTTGDKLGSRSRARL